VLVREEIGENEIEGWLPELQDDKWRDESRPLTHPMNGRGWVGYIEPAKKR